MTHGEEERTQAFRQILRSATTRMNHTGITVPLLSLSFIHLPLLLYLWIFPKFSHLHDLAFGLTNNEGFILTNITDQLPLCVLERS
jgi:hypothetical protein